MTHLSLSIFDSFLSTVLLNLSRVVWCNYIQWGLVDSQFTPDGFSQFMIWFLSSYCHIPKRHKVLNILFNVIIRDVNQLLGIGTMRWFNFAWCLDFSLFLLCNIFVLTRRYLKICGNSLCESYYHQVQLVQLLYLPVFRYLGYACVASLRVPQPLIIRHIFLSKAVMSL